MPCICIRLLYIASRQTPLIGGDTWRITFNIIYSFSIAARGTDVFRCAATFTCRWRVLLAMRVTYSTFHDESYSSYAAKGLTRHPDSYRYQVTVTETIKSDSWRKKINNTSACNKKNKAKTWNVSDHYNIDDYNTLYNVVMNLPGDITGWWHPRHLSCWQSLVTTTESAMQDSQQNTPLCNTQITAHTLQCSITITLHDNQHFSIFTCCKPGPSASRTLVYQATLTVVHGFNIFTVCHYKGSHI